MEIQSLTYEKYQDTFPAFYHVFNSAAFAKHNEAKCEEVLFLGFFKDNKPRLGLTAGIRNGCLNSPFSAPFGGFTFLKEDVKIGYLDEALIALEKFAKEKGLTNIKMVLPPDCYHRSFISKQINALQRSAYLTPYIDLNYQFFTKDFTENYLNEIWYNAKKNYNRAIKSTLRFQKQETIEGKRHVYNIVARNRASRGFPLRMTWEQVWSTAEIVQADFFLVTNINEEAIASAIVFHVASKIVQVIYWGDLPEFAELKTMNFLSYSVFAYYKNEGVELIDIGPSTESGIPNFGLCEFKESIGCEISTKLSFLKAI